MSGVKDNSRIHTQSELSIHMYQHQSRCFEFGRDVNSYLGKVITLYDYKLESVLNTLMNVNVFTYMYNEML